MKRWRLNIPLQFLGWGIVLSHSVCLYLLIAVILWQHDLHWSAWLLYWITGALAVIRWTLYTLFDVDGDGAEGSG